MRTIQQVRNFLHKRIARSIFGNHVLAAQSLRFGGSVAGRIDDFAYGRVRGWVYDARRPNQPTKLKLMVDNAVVDEHTTDVYRDDIAMLANNSGMNGFEIDFRGYVRPASNSATIKIVLADDRKYVIGPVVLMLGSPLQVGDHRRFDAGSSSMDDDITRQFRHLFAHVTATFEDTRARLEGLQAILAAGQNGLPSQVMSGRAALVLGGRTAPAQFRSALTGIGSFHGGSIDDKAEEDVMAARIEAHLRDARDMFRTA